MSLIEQTIPATQSSSPIVEEPIITPTQVLAEQRRMMEIQQSESNVMRQRLVQMDQQFIQFLNFASRL